MLFENEFIPGDADSQVAGSQVLLVLVFRMKECVWKRLPDLGPRWCDVIQACSDSRGGEGRGGKGRKGPLTHPRAMPRLGKCMESGTGEAAGQGTRGQRERARKGHF